MHALHSTLRLAVRSAAAAVVVTGILLVVCPAASGAQVVGTVPLNPAHVGAMADDFVGSEAECAGTVVAPGQVLWHFVVPQNDEFVELTVAFQNAGVITLNEGEFGPPSNSHAFITTAVGDVLLSGTAQVDSDNDDLPAFFNLSHTCFGPETPTTTTTTTTSSTTTTTTQPATTTTAPPGPTTTAPSGPVTTVPAGPVTGGRVPAFTGPEQTGWWPPSLRTSLYLLGGGLLAFLLTGDRLVAAVRRAWPGGAPRSRR